MNADEVVENLARQLHGWYMEAVKELDPMFYNKDAEKDYDYLTPEQQSIDKFIARKILSGDLVPRLKGCMCGSGYASDCEVYNPKRPVSVERIVKVLENKFRIVEGVTMEWDGTNATEVVLFEDVAKAILAEINEGEGK